jgi:ankyrin repeat protein
MPHEALFAAVQAGNLRAVEQALDALGAIVEVVDAHGHTLATWAAEHG